MRPWLARVFRVWDSPGSIPWVNICVALGDLRRRPPNPTKATMEGPSRRRRTADHDTLSGFPLVKYVCFCPWRNFQRCCLRSLGIAKNDRVVVGRIGTHPENYTDLGFEKFEFVESQTQIYHRLVVAGRHTAGRGRAGRGGAESRRDGSPRRQLTLWHPKGTASNCAGRIFASKDKRNPMNL